MEIYKDIKGYEGLYQVSSLGNIRRLKSVVKCKADFSRIVNERVLRSSGDGGGYLGVTLSKGSICNRFKIHQLVAIAFLDHTPNGHKLVVNHKDFDKNNNSVKNLEIVTQRNNTNRKHLKSSSKYTGVSFDKQSNKWRADIRIKGKNKYLGLYFNESNAHLAYQQALKLIK